VHVAIGSLNPAKVAATEAAFRTVWPDDSWSFEPVATPSGVSDQPMSDSESIRGARNRAHAAIAMTGADFGAGIESGLTEIDGIWFSTGWIVIADREGREGLSSSMIRPVPLPSLALVQQGHELGVADDIVFDTFNSKQGTGLIGLLTNDLLTREGVFRDAIISALARFLHPDLFDQA
jgi:inosine/xanthosine triphosphatase